MKEIMRAETRKKNKITIIVWSIVLAIGVAMIVPSLLNSMKKAVSLVDMIDEFYEDDEFDDDEYEAMVGRKVTVEIEYVLDRYYSDGSDKGYLVYDAETGFCYGINVDYSDYELMEKMLKQTQKWLNYETDDLPDPVKITGVIRELESDESFDFNRSGKSIQCYFGDEDYRNYTLVYTIETVNSNNNSYIVAIFGGMLAYGGIIGLIYGLVVHFTNFKYRKIKKFINKNGLNEFEVENDFKASVRIKHIFVGKKYTYNMDGTCWKMSRNDDVVWAYYHRITGRYSVSRIESYHYNKKCTYINASKEVSEAVLQYYGQVFPHMVLGYSIDLRNTYYSDFSKFLSFRYIPAQQKANAQAAGQNTYANQNQQTTAYNNAQPQQAASVSDPISVEIMEKQAQGFYRTPGAYSVSFVDVGMTTIKVIKYVRELFGLGLREAKNIVDAQGIIVKNISKEAADDIRRILEMAGCIIAVTQDMGAGANTASAQTASVNSSASASTAARTANKYNAPGTYSVRFVYVGTKKDETVKCVMEILGCGIDEANELVGSQGVIAKNISKEAAEEIKKVLETVDNVVTVSSYSI